MKSVKWSIRNIAGDIRWGIDKIHRPPIEGGCLECISYERSIEIPVSMKVMASDSNVAHEIAFNMSKEIKDEKGR